MRSAIMAAIGLTDSEADELLADAQVVTLARGEVWTREGDVATKVAFISEGMLRHFHYSPSGEVTRWIAVTGTFTGSLASLLQRSPSYESIAAIERSTLVTFPFADFYAQTARSPSLLRFWIATIEGNYLGIETRVHALIALSAAERYEGMKKQFPEIVLRAPLQYVASMLGITPQHLSRLRAQR
jgi:CRP/FNR family transcriptional regulator, anaerobic regulatory protein